jgi:tellurite resistance protein TerC
MLAKFHYLKYSLIVILTFVGIKLLLAHHYKFPEWFSLTVIAISLSAGVIVSLRLMNKNEA